jgi:WD40 repeat protein
LPQRNDNNLYLWDTASVTKPLLTFSGHTDTVKEFVWRKLGNEYQLVTWSKDQHLRLWPVDPANLVVSRSNSLSKATERGFSNHGQFH